MSGLASSLGLQQVAAPSVVCSSEGEGAAGEASQLYLARMHASADLPLKQESR